MRVFLTLITAILTGAISLHTVHASLPVQDDMSSYVTRAEAMMLILSSTQAKIPAQPYYGQFPDLEENAWYADYMLLGLANGIIEPNAAEGLLEPHEPVTRAALLKMFSRALTLPTNLPHSYSDTKSAQWYSPYVGVAYKFKLFPNAETASSLHPHALVSHSEASYAMQVLLNVYPLMRKTAKSHYRMRGIVYSTRHSSAPERTEFVGSGTKAPPTDSGAKLTAKMVKKAMMSILKKNAVINSATKLDIITRTNEERVKAGLMPLFENAKLSMAAALHAEDMWKRKYFEHISPEGNSYVDRIRSTGYLNTTPSACGCAEQCVCQMQYAVGENIAQGQLTTDHVMDDWLESAAHRENILQKDFSEIGVGLFGNIWVQTFGKRVYYSDE